ncbi:hypothetical protein WG906_03210 [Pedobacter sp. P351]|uniref:hypothetical protein n=1 Tax=Pedobacter superstes TaxID=3133441 RepID=UPI00309A0377
METFYYVFSHQQLHVERFHICAWEFSNKTSLVEFGCEILISELLEIDELKITFYIPWLKKVGKEPQDLYGSLKSPANSKFIFNEAVKNTEYLDGGRTNNGVIHSFEKRSLAILPLKFKKSEGEILTVQPDISGLNNHRDKENLSIYFRFYLEPSLSDITLRKTGIAKSNIIYDIKINEARNLPDFLLGSKLCGIKNCFSFNIIPNRHDIIFFDSQALQNIRVLEFLSFKQYLPDKPVKEDDLLVIFNKKSGDKLNFFMVFSKELIGPAQYLFAIILNLICSIILANPSYSISFGKYSWEFSSILLSAIIVLAAIFVFLLPYLRAKLFKPKTRVR